MSDAADTRGNDCTVVVNPTSGQGDHLDRVYTLGERYGFTVRETEQAGDARRLAAEAVRDGVDRIGAAGGDGTVNGVVTGITDAEGFDAVTLGVVPAGTGNNFAGNVGVTSIDHGFELLANGETREIDLGVAGDHVFVNSCICGLTADASGRTTSELKGRLGELAYILKTIETATSFDPIPLRVHARGEPDWDGEAAFVLIGNARRFPAGGDEQAHVEDGRFDVTIIEEVSGSVLRDAAVEGLLGGETADITRLKPDRLMVDVKRDEPVSFSFDGEMASFRHLECSVRPRTLSIRVGDDYVPDPE